MGDASIDARLPRRGEWAGAVLSMPAYVTGDGEPYRPDLVVWVDTSSGMIVGSEMVRPGEALDRAAALFAGATRAPLVGKPRVPRRLRVAERDLYDALADRVGRVELVLAPTPEMDEVLETLREQMAESGGPESAATHLVDGITADDMAGLYRAAAHFYRAAPWRSIPADAFLRISCDRLNMTDGALCVVGQSGEAFGFAQLDSTSDAIAYCDALDDLEEGGGRPVLPPHRMLTYNDRDDLAPSLLREIESYGWETAGPDALPAIAAIDTDLVARPLARDELVAMTAIIEAISGLVEAEPDLAAAWDDGPSRAWKRSIDTTIGPVAVEIAAPLILESEAESRSASLLEQFARSPECESEIQHELAEVLLDLTSAEYDCDITELPPADVQSLLFEAIPSQVTTDPDTAPEIVGTLRALLRFAARELGSLTAARCLEQFPDDAAPRLAEALGDPRNFGPIKSLLFAGAQAGYDITSEEGLAAFLAAVEEAGPEGFPAPPASSSGRPARSTSPPARSRSKKRRT